MVQEVRDALALDLLKQLLHLAQVLDSDQFTFGFALEQGTFFFVRASSLNKCRT